MLPYQLALSEYDFTIGNLFEDLHDGIILCRVVQLLLSDASVILVCIFFLTLAGCLLPLDLQRHHALFQKVIAPSDTHKKKLHNCTTAIQYIKQAGAPISDADGVTISAEDIVNGDKELILSLLWNMFIHMQVNLNMRFNIALLQSKFSIVITHLSFVLKNKDLK